MKKLIIAAAVACVATMSYAAAANWKASADSIHNGTGVEDVYWSGTAYIFDADIMTQSALFDIFAAGTAIGSSTSGYVGSGSVDDGALSGASWSYGEQGDGHTYNYFFALVDTDKIYLSQTKGATPNASASPKMIGYGDQYGWDSGATLPNSYSLPTEGFVNAGAWAAPVPEPTCGLLVLLGVAGLALRRGRRV